MAIVNLSRRQFLKGSALTAGGLIIGFKLPLVRKSRASEIILPTDEDSIDSWVQITPKGQVVLVVPVSEMGQGSQTAVSMIFADELGADLSAIKIIVPSFNPIYNNPLFGGQITGGSTAVRAWWNPLRKVAATIRYMLIEVASEEWGVDESICISQNSQIINTKTKQSFDFKALIDQARDGIPPEKVAFKKPDQYQYIGKAMPRLDALPKVTGAPIFGIDVVVPKMLIATIEQSPVFGGEVATMNKKDALSVKGVKAVVKIKHGIAVVAQTYWQAKTGLEKLSPTFVGGKTLGLTTQKIVNILKSGLQEPGKIVKKTNFKTKETAIKTIEEDFYSPYLAHSTLEPMNATAYVKPDGTCEIWAPTQNISQTATSAAKILNISPEEVTVHTTFLGGGFGRRSFVDFIEQAVEISAQTKTPIKVIWSRKQDMQHDFYRPASLSKYRVQVDNKGFPVSWYVKIISDSIIGNINNNSTMIDRFMSEGIDTQEYQIPQFLVAVVRKNLSVPIGWWRSVGHSNNSHTLEHMMGILAHNANIDQLAYRQKLLAKNSRSYQVLDQVATLSDWHKPLGNNKAKGIAQVHSFGSYVAQVVALSKQDDGKISIDEIYCVIDCGLVINPEIVKRQMQSAIVYGLTAALHGKINFKAGRVVEENFNDYPALLMKDIPPIKVKIVNSTLNPGGYGEPGLPPLAPALANAILMITNKKNTELPISGIS